MGREVRKVRANWDHQAYCERNNIGYPHLFDGFKAKLEAWLEGRDQWAKGLCKIGDDWEPIPQEYIDDDPNLDYEEWTGPQPDPKAYMPDWDKSERTHYQMYENTTEGYPISPVFATKQELLEWLVKNKASRFADYSGDRSYWEAVLANVD